MRRGPLLRGARGGGPAGWAERCQRAGWGAAWPGVCFRGPFGSCIRGMVVGIPCQGRVTGTQRTMTSTPLGSAQLCLSPASASPRLSLPLPSGGGLGLRARTSRPPVELLADPALPWGAHSVTLDRRRGGSRAILSGLPGPDP